MSIMLLQRHQQTHIVLADGSCSLAISTELEARCYMDAGQAAMRADHNDHCNVQCPITVGVGDSNQGPVSFLAAEGIKQARHFPHGRSERLVLLQLLLHLLPS